MHLFIISSIQGSLFRPFYEDNSLVLTMKNVSISDKFSVRIEPCIGMGTGSRLVPSQKKLVEVFLNLELSRKTLSVSCNLSKTPRTP